MRPAPGIRHQPPEHRRIEHALQLLPLRAAADGQVVAVLEFHVDTAAYAAARELAAGFECLHQLAALGGVQGAIGDLDEIIVAAVHVRGPVITRFHGHTMPAPGQSRDACVTALRTV